MENKFYRTKVNALLDHTKILMKKKEDFKKYTGETFNIFSILNMERLEVKTHSALIYDLLNVKGSHSQEDLFLKVFIEEIIKIEDFNYKNIIVERERCIGKLGRIDLVLENDEYLIIIEMKIDAKDQENQLKRYDTYGKRSGKKYKIYYLTLFGDEASEDSVGSEDAKLEYECLSFREDMYNWINQCIRKDRIPLLPIIRETLYQYVKVIEKITNRSDQGIMKEIKEILLKGNNLEIAEKMLEAIPYAKAEIEFEFWQKLYEKYNKDIEAYGLTHVDDGEFPYDVDASIETVTECRKSKKCGYWLEYSIGEYKGDKVVICIGNSGYDPNIYVSIGLKDHEENIISCSEYNKKLLKMFTNLGFNKTGGFKYRYLKYDLNFYTKIYKLTDRKIMNEAVECIGHEVLEITKKVGMSKELSSLMK